MTTVDGQRSNWRAAVDECIIGAFAELDFTERDIVFCAFDAPAVGGLLSHDTGGGGSWGLSALRWAGAAGSRTGLAGRVTYVGRGCACGKQRTFMCDLYSTTGIPPSGRGLRRCKLFLVEERCA